MDLRRFVDLYLTETQEHVRLLQRSLLALEAGDESALDEAFRACHTLKSLSAAMGYTVPADIAHGMEDRLDEVRTGRVDLTGGFMDDLLAESDSLDAAVRAAAQTPPVEPDEGEPVAAPHAVRHVAWPAAPPTGTARTARVKLSPEAPLKSARAVLMMRALAALPDVLGSEPADFDDSFAGTFFVFFGPAADPAAAERAMHAAGDIESIDFDDPASSLARAAPLPPRQLRVDARRVDGIAEAVGELSVLFGSVAAPAAAVPAFADAIGRMGVVMGVLQHEVLALRMVPVRETFEVLPRVVRDAARSGAREIELVVAGEDVELDRLILAEITEPLTHMLRNAAGHGIEPPDERVAAGKPSKGRITVAAERERSSVRITVSDDGRGVDTERVVALAKAAGLLDADAAPDLDGMELLRLISNPGLSTAAQVSAVSGRGVGMDVVVSRLRALGGAIQLETERGVGTTFTIRLPLTLAVAQALRVSIGGEQYAIPLTHVAEAIELEGAVVRNRDAEMVQVRGELIPLVRLGRMLQIGGGGETAAVIAELGGRRRALAVDELIGREHILVRSFDAAVGMLPYFSGATLLADGRPALVLDPLSVI
jgi:two-component system, chemotaxis family, sensor kinase CheA